MAQHDNGRRSPGQQAGAWQQGGHREHGGGHGHQEQYDAGRPQQGDNWRERQGPASGGWRPAMEERDRGWDEDRGGHGSFGGQAADNDYGNRGITESGDFQNYEPRGGAGRRYDGHHHGDGDGDWNDGGGGSRGGADSRRGQALSAGPGRGRSAARDEHGNGHHGPADIDADYRQWRSAQIEKLDRDYAEWRRHRYERFAQDFDQWRASRAEGRGDGQPGVAQGGPAGGASLSELSDKPPAGASRPEVSGIGDKGAAKPVK